MANKNIIKLDNFPSPNKAILSHFIEKINELGWWVEITSGYRSFEEQDKLKEKNSKNASPGSSPHEFYQAIDINPINKITGKRLMKESPKEEWIESGIPQLANSLGLIWGDFPNYIDRVHFQFSREVLNEDGTVDGKEWAEKFVEFDENKSSYDEWKTDIGGSYIESLLINTKKPKRDEFITKVSEVKELKATGIWQIIKLVADQYSLSQNINDATIAMNQGSLLNFVQKIIQKPWLEFWGDTVGDQYYFFARKEPFDFNGMNSLPVVKNIKQNEVISDELSWYEGDVFSWYQIIPRGSFLGEQNMIFAYVSAVFFEEFAEIFGSKPNIQVSNYLNFTKISEDNKMFSKAIDDLRYMVESNCYLPFTRQGTITIGIDTTIKRGYKLFYAPTGEMFYVDSVSHSYNSGEDGSSGTTSIRVSRGMIQRYMDYYFQIIDFDDPPPTEQEYEETVQDNNIFFFFDKNRNYLIDLTEVFENDSDKEMLEQIEEFPNSRNELKAKNQISINSIVEYVKKHKDANFYCLGTIEENEDESLAEQRAKTIKSIVITEYMKKYNDLTEDELSEKIIESGYSGKDFIVNSDFVLQTGEADGVQLVSENSKQRAQKRTVIFRVQEYQVKKSKEVYQKGVAWKVNRRMFNFFLNRKQFVSDV